MKSPVAENRDVITQNKPLGCDGGVAGREGDRSSALNRHLQTQMILLIYDGAEVCFSKVEFGYNRLLQ